MADTIKGVADVKRTSKVVRGGGIAAITTTIVTLLAAALTDYVKTGKFEFTPAMAIAVGMLVNAIFEVMTKSKLKAKERNLEELVHREAIMCSRSAAAIVLLQREVARLGDINQIGHLTLTPTAKSRKSFRQKLYTGLGAFHGFHERDNINPQTDLNVADIEMGEYNLDNRRGTHPTVGLTDVDSYVNLKTLDGRRVQPMENYALTTEEVESSFKRSPQRVSFGKGNVIPDQEVPGYTSLKRPGPTLPDMRDSYLVEPEGKNPGDALAKSNLLKKLG